MSEAEVLTGAEPVYGDPEAIRQAASYVPSPTIIVYSDDKSCLLYTSPSPRD